MSLTEAIRPGNSPSSHPLAWPAIGAAVDMAATLAGADEDLRALKRIGTTVRVARNRTIFNEGDPAEHAYKLVSGVVRLCKHMADGRRQIVQFLFPGDFFSFMELAGHRLSAEAVSDVVLTSYSRRLIGQLGRDKPSVRERFLTLMSQRLHHMHDHLIVLGRQTAAERVASFLVLLWERIGTGDDQVIDVTMSRQDIADFLGLTIETVCRVLSKLKRARIIDIPDLHRLVLRDIDALYLMAGGGE